MYYCKALSSSAKGQKQNSKLLVKKKEERASAGGTQLIEVVIIGFDHHNKLTDCVWKAKAQFKRKTFHVPN